MKQSTMAGMQLVDLDVRNKESRLMHRPSEKLGGGFKCFLFSPLFGEDFHFDYCNIFQRG